MSAHTPGPWRARSYDHGQTWKVETDPPGGGYVASYIGGLRGEDKANAHLVSAAPELLATWRDYIELWNVRHEIEGCPEDDTCECPLVARINAAVLKAEGR